LALRTLIVSLDVVPMMLIVVMPPALVSSVTWPFTTDTWNDAELTAPSSSRTLKVTVYVPFFAYACRSIIASASSLEWNATHVPSPKSHDTS
jgi:hypothetical protein